MQYFTPCWEQRGDINHEVSNRKPTEKPENYDLMIRLAETLACRIFRMYESIFYNIAGNRFLRRDDFLHRGRFSTPSTLMRSSRTGSIASSESYSFCLSRIRNCECSGVGSYLSECG